MIMTLWISALMGSIVGSTTAPPLALDMFTPSATDQVKLGQRAASQIRQQQKVLPASDPRVRLLRRVANRILASVNDPKKPWEYSFDVIESKELNAFALPGGPTFFYSGLIDKMKTEDELAGVLGHELTHVRKEHWAHMYGEQQKRDLGITLVLVFTKANRALSDLASIGNDVFFNLRYSRRAEGEADDGGFDLTSKAGYNPEGMADVFRLFATAIHGEKSPEFLSDHPSDQRRIQHIEDRIAKSGVAYPQQRPIRY